MIMTSQRELFPRLTADMRRFRKLPQIHRDPGELGGRLPPERAEGAGSRTNEQGIWEETPSEAAAASAPSDGNEFYPLSRGGSEAQGLLYPSPLFPLLNNEVASAHRQIQASVEQAMGHCRRDNLWRRLFHGEHLALDKLKLTKLSFSELEELLAAVQSRSVGEIDPQLVRMCGPTLGSSTASHNWAAGLVQLSDQIITKTRITASKERNTSTSVCISSHSARSRYLKINEKLKFVIS